MFLLVPTVLSAEPLLVEAFDGPTLSPGWTTVEGASTGDGPTAKVGVEGGAFWSRVSKGDTHFPAIVHDVELGGAAWVKVSARMTTQNVDPAAAKYDNCDVFVRLSGVTLQALPVVTGTTPWTTLSRVFNVPAGATLQVGLFLSMPGAAGFDDVRVEAVDPGWRTEPSAPFVYHLLPGDEISEAQKADNLAGYQAAVQFLDRMEPPTIDFWKYPDNPTKALYTGDAGNAHAVRGQRAIHSIWSVERHEVVHVLSGGWGDPPALLSEGLAVWLSGQWQGQAVATYAHSIGERWLGYSSIANTADFRKQDDLRTYAEGGALVGWLLHTRGRDGLRTVYGALDRRGGAAELEAALGMKLADVDAAVRAWAAR